MAGRLVTVGGAVLGEVREPARRGAKGHFLAQRRLDELHALLRHRHGKPPPDAPYWVRPYVDLLIWTAREAGRALDEDGLIDRVRLLCPAIDPDGLRTTCTLALEWPRRWSATDLGTWLKLDLLERKALAIRTIRAAGDTPAQAAARKRKEDRDRIMTKRRADGMRPRKEFIEESEAAEARRLGVSRSTLWRRKRSERNTSVANNGTPDTRYRRVSPLQYLSISPAAAILFDRAAQALRRPLSEPDPEVVLTPGARRLLGILFERGSFDDARHDVAAGRV